MTVIEALLFVINQILLFVFIPFQLVVCHSLFSLLSVSKILSSINAFSHDFGSSIFLILTCLLTCPETN